MNNEVNTALAAVLGQIAERGTPTRKVDWTSIDTPVKHAGKELILPGDPAPMPYKAARDLLEQVEEQENQRFDTMEIVKGAPWDALVAVYKAMQEVYGVVLSKSIRTFFGEILPDMVTVNTGPGPKDRLQVPMGNMQLPNVSDPVNVSLHPDGVRIMGKVRRADRAILVDIANTAARILRESSIYRGKAIRLGVDEDGDLELNRQPEFLDLDNVQESDMIHAAETNGQIRTSILAPLKNTQACRKHKIPLKRGILLEGPYGTGKSLTARVTAKVATDNGWTFVILDRAQGLRTGIEFARAYQPCVIFAEDIDRAADREDENVNDLVNLLDGVITKNMEVMVVLTTNFVEKIDRALLRPGRFDAIVSIQPPDAEAAEKLVRHYARELLDADTNLETVGEATRGWIPATIREVVERAKLSMLVENRNTLSAEDLVIAATGMRRHMELLNPVVVTETAADRLWAVQKELVLAAITDGADALATTDDVRDVANTTTRTEIRVQNLRAEVGAVAQHARAGGEAAQKALEAAEAGLCKEIGERVPGGEYRLRDGRRIA